jgi:hypothetical protein
MFQSSHRKAGENVNSLRWVAVDNLGTREDNISKTKVSLE